VDTATQFNSAEVSTPFYYK